MPENVGGPFYVTYVTNFVNVLRRILLISNQSLHKIKIKLLGDDRGLFA